VIILTCFAAAGASAAADSGSGLGLLSGSGAGDAAAFMAATKVTSATTQMKIACRVPCCYYSKRLKQAR
jgi:hypothetical protein